MATSTDELQVGQLVTRKIGHDGPSMTLTITTLTPDKVVCSAWEFSRKTGFELDEFLGWTETVSGSYLEELYNEYIKQQG